MQNTQTTPEGSLATLSPSEASPNELTGVRGWLRFFVVVRIYVDPVLTTLGLLLSWAGVMLVADKYPMLMLLTGIETVVAIALVVRGVGVGVALRDRAPGAVQDAKSWMQLCLGWSFVSVFLSFATGLDPEDLLAGAVRQILGALVGFAIWYSYFCVSRRVKATYGDTPAVVAVPESPVEPGELPQTS